MTLPNDTDQRRAGAEADAPDWAYDEDPADFDSEDDGGFECAAYWTGTDWHCPLAGSEECDWECTDPPWNEELDQ